MIPDLGIVCSLTSERVNQSKKQLKKWRVDHKRLKGAEYKAIIRKKRERERADAAKKTEFRLPGKEIKQSKIIRFQRGKKSILKTSFRR